MWKLKQEINFAYENVNIQFLMFIETLQAYPLKKQAVSFSNHYAE